eukprot:jgi/Psemu1/183213/e_gw1.30.228.1
MQPQPQTQPQKQRHPPHGTRAQPFVSSVSISTTRTSNGRASISGLIPSQVGGKNLNRVRLSSSSLSSASGADSADADSADTDTNTDTDTEQSHETKTKSGTKPKPKPKQKQEHPHDKHKQPGNQTKPNHRKPNTKPRSRSRSIGSNGNENENGNHHPIKSNGGNNGKAKPKQKAKQKAKRQRQRRQSGNLPDVLWRHIPMEHVRMHPRFVPLPEPETITRLECIEDVRNFRQESWQWDVLHEGRMTTSQAVAALGFLEPTAGEMLGVPRGLRKGGIGAYHRLRKPVAMTTLEEMNHHLCVGIDGGDGDAGGGIVSEDKRTEETNNYWTQPSSFPFAAKYMVQITEHDLETRKKLAKDIAKTKWSIRMVWGNVQEATSLLTALNYFWKRDHRVTMNEIGMCGAGLDFNQTTALRSETGLLLGATPDAVLCHPDGTIEAVEVKNHCPYVPNDYYRSTKPGNGKGNHHQHAFRLSRQSLSWNRNSTMMCTYLPQLMMEMLCLGKNCVSAIMVRQTATNGSLILRIKRDDDWIEEMIYWLDRFHKDYVRQGIPPPKNFFLEGSGGSGSIGSSSDDDDDNPEDRERYRRFLEFTKRIESDNVELLEHVPNRSVQRAMAMHSVANDLFLD